VAVIGRSGRRRHGDLFAVRLRITRPGQGEVLIDRNPDEDHAHEDVYVAIRDAFNAARRRLQDNARRLGGQVKRHEPQPHGRVSSIQTDEGFGFIETADGRELYFHRNAVEGGEFDQLQPGDPVRFIEGPGEKGPRASTVRPAHGLHPET
jgi:cold shock CspA family protein